MNPVSKKLLLLCIIAVIAIFLIIAVVYLNSSGKYLNLASVFDPNYSKTQPLINVLPLSNSKQAIIVTVADVSDKDGTITVFEKTGNKKWKQLWTYPCVVGILGVNANRHEGDLTTPEGIYGFLFEFGSADNPGTKMEYRKTQPGDYWSALETQSEYNTWVHYDGDDPIERFGFDRYEDLYAQPLYKYAAALDFNYYEDSKVVGKGNAIFLHIAPPGGGGTGGCIALSEEGLVQILKWMDPAREPKICIGTETYLRGLK